MIDCLSFPGLKIPQVASKSSTPSTSITEHPGFHAVCLGTTGGLLSVQATIWIISFTNE